MRGVSNISAFSFVIPAGNLTGQRLTPVRFPAGMTGRARRVVNWAVFTIFFLCVVPHAFSQDLHFSQWFNSPLTTNPANTGFIPNADYRIGANYRNQYINVLSVPYKTISLYGDAQLFREKLENAWIGAGGVILRDVAGSGNLTSTKIYGSLAYHQLIGYNSLLTAGFNLGWANKHVDVSKLTFPDQFNSSTGFFDAGIPSSVVFTNSNTSYFDMQAGINYAYFPSDKIYVNGGISVHHINRPRETFFDNSNGFDNRLAPRYIGFINASIKLNNQFIVNPMAYYSNQAKASEFVIGGNFNYNLSGDGTTQILGGAYYRSGDAIIPMIGFQWNNFRMTFTYDVTTSALKGYNSARGATEFSLVKEGFYNEDGGTLRQSLCPQF